MRKHLVSLTVGLVVGAVVAGGIAYAAIPDSTTKQITACIAKSGTNKGATRIIDAQRGATCKTTETKISWSATGANWRGTWSSGAAYRANDVVYHQGSSYRARRTNNGVAPGTSGADWTYLARAGATGPQGPAGQDATLDRPGHTVTTVDLVPGHAVGRDPATAIGVDGLAVIVHGDYDGTLRVTHCEDVACTTSTSTMVDDPAGTVGSDNSIAIGSDGFPVIATQDSTSATLRVTHCEDVACTTSTSGTVDDPVGPVGYQTSLAIGPDGLAVVAHLSPSVGLRFTHCDDVACATASSVTISNGNIIGVEPSVSIGTDGLPIVAYRDSTDASLVVHHCNDATCTSSSLLTVDDPANSVGWRAALAIGVDGNPIVAHQDEDALNLRLTHCDDTTCTSADSAIIDTEVGSGTVSEILIGSDGRPLVVHYDNAGGIHLRATHCGDVTCTNATSIELVEVDGPSGTMAAALGVDGLALMAYPNGDALEVLHCANRFCVPHHRP